MQSRIGYQTCPCGATRPVPVGAQHAKRVKLCEDCARKRNRDRARIPTGPCEVEGCDQQTIQRRPACPMHMARLRRHGDYGPPNPLPRRPATVCGADDCARMAQSGGYCGTHWRRVKRTGSPMADVPIGAMRWPEGSRGFTDSSGYRCFRVDGREFKEHRLVMERSLGRPLLPDETVHHVNGDRSDNRPENLELWSSRHPKGQRVTDKVSWAVELLSLYAPEELSRNTLLAVAS